MSLLGKNFGALITLYSEIGGVCVDTVFGHISGKSMERGSAGGKVMAG